MNRTPLQLLALTACLMSAALTAPAHAEEHIKRLQHRDADSAGRVVAVEGEAGKIVRGRRKHVDEDGHVVTGRGAAIRTPEGGRAARAGRIVRSPDGTVTHQGAFAADGTRGSVKSQGEVTRTPDGDVSGERHTSATGTQGNTYQGSTTYSKGEGVSHTGTCTDATGNTMPCQR